MMTIAIIIAVAVFSIMNPYRQRLPVTVGKKFYAPLKDFLHDEAIRLFRQGIFWLP